MNKPFVPAKRTRGARSDETKQWMPPFAGMNGVHGAKHGNAEEDEASKIQGGG
jgi:hypothetical protein